MNRPHGNTGKRNAAKPAEERAESSLYVKVPTRQKSGWVKKAQRKGMKLSEWVRQTLDAAD